MFPEVGLFLFRAKVLSEGINTTWIHQKVVAVFLFVSFSRVNLLWGRGINQTDEGSVLQTFREVIITAVLLPSVQIKLVSQSHRPYLWEVLRRVIVLLLMTSFESSFTGELLAL